MLNRQNHSTEDPEELLEKTRTWEAKFTSEDRSQEIEHIVTPPQLAGRPFLQNSILDQTFDVPDTSLHFTCLTIGTRGDVQPYIALCKGLMAKGHRCRIATHDEYKEWIEEHNIEFCSVGGDPGELMVNQNFQDLERWTFFERANPPCVCFFYTLAPVR
jgi:sterol 3beta-glucosyltransferase